MGPDEVRAIIDEGESFEAEFKRDVNDHDLTLAAVCLANGRGGHIILGVDDGGELVGTRRRHGQTTDPALVNAMIANTTSPALATTTDVVDIDGSHVVVVRVTQASGLVSTTAGVYVRRALGVRGNPQCLPVLPHDAVARLSTIGEQDLSALPIADVEMADLDEIEIGRYRENVRAVGDAALADLSNADLVGALGLRTTDGTLTTGAVLLFGDDGAIRRHVPTHETAFQVLDGLNVSVDRVGCPPLVRAMQELSAEIGTHNPEDEVEVGLLRIPLPRFSDVAIRESLANALVHRNYGVRDRLRVAIEDGELAITSPGSFPEGVRLDNLLNTPPRPRNPALADAFKRAGLVERTGRGINRAFEGQLGIGRPAPDYTRSTDEWVEVRLPAGPADRNLAAFVAEMRARGEVDLQDLQALHEVRHASRITTDRAALLMQTSPDDARTVLNRLVERGLLEARGERKGRSYHLAATVYEQLGERNEYVRTRGFDIVQQEQMVLTYLARYGRINRAGAAELCQLSPAQATTLLRRMRDAGKLELRGEKRGSHYVLAGTPDGG